MTSPQHIGPAVLGEATPSWLRPPRGSVSGRWPWLLPRASFLPTGLGASFGICIGDLWLAAGLASCGCPEVSLLLELPVLLESEDAAESFEAECAEERVEPDVTDEPPTLLRFASPSDRVGEAWTLLSLLWFVGFATTSDGVTLAPSALSCRMEQNRTEATQPQQTKPAITNPTTTLAEAPPLSSVEAAEESAMDA